VRIPDTAEGFRRLKSPINLTLQDQHTITESVPNPMDPTYLVEIRLSRTKWRVKRIITGLGHRFGIGDALELHPHVTLYGPLVLNNDAGEDQMLEAIGRAASRFGPVPFLLDGWERRDGMHGSVIAFPVRPSEPLREMTRDIATAISPLTTSQNVWDADPDEKWFHVTIANRLDAARASAVYRGLTERNGAPPDQQPVRVEKPGLLRRFLPLPVKTAVFERQIRSLPPVLLDETGFRITVMKEMAILAEYDLVGKRWVFGDHRHSSGTWQKALVRYRHHTGLEREDPELPDPGDIFVIADLHLGHANIIRYCSRPFHFPDSREMDHVLIKNWNYSVGPKTRVYCLGDLRYGPDADTVVSYRRRLRGDVTFIRGNHDEDRPGTVAQAAIEHDGMKFLLIHDPADAPADFDGWVIHGHHHNNDLRNYPFINFTGRRVNVSAEIIGYRPVSLREIIQQIRNREASGNTSPVLLRPDTG